jgi:hypothetical protein
MPKSFFILYDCRARTGDTDRASILATAEDKGEAQAISRLFMNQEAVWYEYKEEGTLLVDGCIREDITTNWRDYRKLKKAKANWNAVNRGTERKSNAPRHS